MGDKTAISWTEKTYNPWQGCSKVSPGCAHCYMFRDKKKYGQDPEVVVRSKPATFDKPLKWEREAAAEGKQVLVFTCSWSDFFHADADDWRDDAWDIIRQTPHLTYQILTKRPERIKDHLPADWGKGWPNVWMGTSVENQHFAEIRIPILLQVPAVVRFLSCEPLLGPLDLSKYLPECSGCGAKRGEARGMELARWRWNGVCWEHKCPDIIPQAGHFAEYAGVDWVIVGGESGPNFRQMQPEWARDLQQQCAAAGVAFWYKQGSGLKPGQNAEPDGTEYHEFPTSVAA